MCSTMLSKASTQKTYSTKGTNMPKVVAQRYHDFSCGHRVVGHESKCAGLHGHNYRVHFTVEAVGGNGITDGVGRVVDFSVIKETLCAWIERCWDHAFLARHDDPVLVLLLNTVHAITGSNAADQRELDAVGRSIVFVPFNPTAENMALYLLEVIGPKLLGHSPVKLIHVRVEETRKCAAEAWL